MELCPLRELLRLSTDPPSFSLGFSKESESVGGEWGLLIARSGLDWNAEGKARSHYPCSTILTDSLRLTNSKDSTTYLFRDRTMISLGYVFSHRFSHGLDFLAQRNTRHWWRLHAVSLATISVFCLNFLFKKKERKSREHQLKSVALKTWIFSK